MIEAAEREGIDQLSDIEISDRFFEMVEHLQPDEEISELLDIDFEAHVAAGRTTLLLDAEGTFVENGAWDVDENAKEAVERARAAGIENIAVITNKRPKNETEWTRIASWADQIGADAIFTPLYKGDRKPQPTMINRALDWFDVDKSEAIMAGDKSSADILAARRAGVYSIQVDVVGENDLWLDKNGRRPLEKVFSWAVKCKPSIKRIGKDFIKTTGDQNESIPEFMYLNSFPSEEIANLGLYVGFGDKKLPFQVEREAKVDSEEDELMEAMDQVRNVQSYAKKMMEYTDQHPGLVADASSWARLPLAIVVAGFILNEKWVAAAAAHSFAEATDVVDGLIVRKAIREGREDPDSETRKRGKKLDERMDKVYHFIVGAALVYKDRMSLGNFAMQQGRDGFRVKQRKDFENEVPDADTGADGGGKISTGAQAGSYLFAMVAREDQEAVREVLHTLTTGLKIKSFVESPAKWHKRHEDKGIAKERLQSMTQERVIA